ncbi:hypothetical protein HS041_07925 [Planomonospora sp. ID67723]|uniref:hypothetical protein n=1 Tax=Planomonospora sp. ID67723 TaxID=2738134 RepID=UPI0018C39A99|nr:hypothetical protein [Planomonospora sp. ID67723]MBG0827689.1 hypothetical protein [Planomonospora sp. ID67723]
MLKSKTRRRVMAKTATIAAVGMGVLFGAVPALASMVTAPKPVTYTCTGAGSAPATYKFQMDLTGPAAPTPSSTVVATWRIGTAAPIVTAPSAIPNTERLVVSGDVVISASPTIVPSELRSVAATAPAAAITQGAALQPPNLLITMTPTATGVIAVQPDAFDLYLVPATGTENGAGGELLTCTVSATAEAAAAALLITVKPTTASTGTPTNTSTGTATPAPTNTATASVKPTITVFETVTAKPSRTRQIDRTPDGGASTGGGGDAGPDARVIMLSGALMVAGAAVGGLVLRRRTASRG